MTVRVGTSVVAGSGADAQEVNSLIESVNALMTKVEELTEAVKAGGTSGGSGNLSENVTLTVIIRTPHDLFWSSATVAKGGYFRINGKDYYSNIVGKSVSIDYAPCDVAFQTQVPRNSAVLVEAHIVTSYSSTDGTFGCLAQACVAKDHCTVILESKPDQTQKTELSGKIS